jgi:hypothetical protein
MRIGELKAPVLGISRLVLSRDGKWLATVHSGARPQPQRREPDRVLVWDLAARKQVCEIQAPALGNAAVAISPNGKQIAIGMRTYIGLYDCTSGNRLKTLDFADLDDGGMALPGFVSFTPDGNAVVIAGVGFGPAIACWELGTNKITGKFQRARRGATATRHSLGALSPDGTILATVGPTLRVWDLAAVKRK